MHPEDDKGLTVKCRKAVFLFVAGTVLLGTPSRALAEAAAASQGPAVQRQLKFSGTWHDEVAGDLPYDAAIAIDGPSVIGDVILRTPKNPLALKIQGRISHRYVEATLTSKDGVTFAYLKGSLNDADISAEYDLPAGERGFGRATWDAAVSASLAPQLRPADGAKVSLPELPPLHERFPHLFDEQGHLRPPPPGLLPAPEPMQLRSLDLEAPDWQSRELRGYSGPYFTQFISANRVVVLEHTVTISAAKGWRAMGLVRNETPNVATQIDVIATLSWPDGAVTTVQGRVPIANLRPGEPAPFHLSVTKTGTITPSVTWSTKATFGDATLAGTRDVEISITKHFSFGERERVDLDGYHDPPGYPYPELILGSIANIGTTEIPRPRLVAVWFDDKDRVVRVQDGDYLEPDPKRNGQALLPGRAMLLAVPRDDADPITEAEPSGAAIWETPS